MQKTGRYRVLTITDRIISTSLVEVEDILLAIAGVRETPEGVLPPIEQGVPPGIN